MHHFKTSKHRPLVTAYLQNLFVKSTDAALVRSLLLLGVDPNKRSSDGRLALDEAIAREDFAMIAVLGEFGADVCLMDAHHNFPMLKLAVLSDASQKRFWAALNESFRPLHKDLPDN